MADNTLLLVDEAQSDLELLKKEFSTDDFKLVGATTDGSEAIFLLDKFNPSLVVCGLVLSGVDGLEVLKHVKTLKNPPKTVVVSSMKNEEIIRRTMEYGAAYFMAKPVSASVVKDRVYEVAKKEEISSITVKGEEKHAQSLDEKISKIFISVGIPPHIKGYSYLREGVKMAVDNPKIINSITKELYPMIGVKYDTSASKVERAIRHAIEVAWNRNRIESINSVFGVRAYVGSEKPTNGEFIALVADKMLLEGA